MTKILTEYRRIVLTGYQRMIEGARPNGALNHDVANKLTAIKGAIKLGIDIALDYDNEIKSLIRKLYSNIGNKGV